MNLISVKIYGETEFWFAGIKVTAIVAFVIAGAALMFGVAGSEGLVVFLTSKLVKVYKNYKRLLQK